VVDASVVCISHTDGAAGRAVGEAVAGLLGFQFADEAIVVAAARAEGLLPESVSYAERRQARRSIEVDFGRIERTENLRDLITTAVVRTAEKGNVVIVSHAASYPLAERAGVLRVLVTASDPTRQERVAESDGVDAKEARKRLSESDKGRAAYLERFYGVKREQPTDYDLVVNTDRMSVAEAAQVVAAAATAFE
jgi:cytidylate kinase